MFEKQCPATELEKQALTNLIDQNEITRRQY
jgi:hypothetical protein